MSQGLDYVVTQAAAHGMRLVLTLTNYLAAYGGVQQYVNWYGGGTITDFWQRSDIRQAWGSPYLCTGLTCLYTKSKSQRTPLIQKWSKALWHQR